MDQPSQTTRDVLIEPARARLFAVLREVLRPASTEELAERVGLHANGVRRHLERLREAGLVTRTRERRPRGRPRDQWSIAPKARPGGERPTAQADLARWLTQAIPPRPSRLKDVEKTGRQIGREMAPTAVSPEVAIHTALSALGFQPDTTVEGATLTCVLGNCPYRDAARESPEVICTLHRGITQGLIDVIDPRAKMTNFIPHDADEAGCLIEVAGVTGASSAAERE